ncbi:SpaA isopeptide-forming pilin-related protein [Lacrimispora saccharolytica]|uniref:LPXTG-motif cell wall anchor domain protein n=1 Tax=Lacrimispora saccharolytica (strain ATCC 35040 / DSM 2544 / NRCC 2533 / WM1) TaxID=610130 RepID=D9R3U8_LACSW|nr:SpaA isopeptide-forming pilin-related protein [Lacrimispora saccharolytica]ADL03061.1 LPXTG-motif cell wall anchor domain protein [[Clostridium] saccharolyticum WM1]QRV18757.1 cell wall protein [Lacrimispora saccharolytica]
MIRYWKKGTKLNQRIAAMLVAVLLLTPVFTYLPPSMFDSWGFGLKFVSSGQAGHPYLMGKAPGDKEETYFFCMNKGASAHSNYDYSKVNANIDYNNGTIEQKRMFWAYIGAFGSHDGNPQLDRFGKISREEAREVAWSKGKSNGGSAWIENMANDGFMSLENVPEGCKSPKEILDLISKHNTSGQAMYINDLRSGPGQIDTKKLYELTGLKDWETFKRYCKITEVTSGMVINTEGQNLSWSFPNAPAGQKPTEAVMKISYDPTAFRVLEVTGSLEYFQCNVPGSQQLYRAKGRLKELTCEFYLTTKYSANAPTPTLGDEEVSLKVYQHNETFESNYNVGLEKMDYETGNPLPGSTWQVLEQFDDSQLSDDETDGGIIEDNMREEPTTWQDWMVFDDDLVTDASGRISHKDTRYYDFGHAYCNGHPIPPEPEIDESEEGEEGEGSDEADEAAEEYERLMEEWQAGVDDCEARAAASGGTFHHWECGNEEEPSEEEAFEASGCKAARDAAYETFINLEYDYTFRETKPRDGYIIHDPGHPDDVPIEIITTAASEAERSAKWKSSSNADIRVTGYVRNMTKDSSDNEDLQGFAVQSLANRADLESEDYDLISENKMLLSDSDNLLASPSESFEDPDQSGDLILKETYDLPLGERIINKLLKFIGLPTAFAEEKEITVKLVAKDDEELLDDEFEEYEFEEDDEFLDESIDDDESTPSQAKKNFINYSLRSSLATNSIASKSEEKRATRQISLFAAEDTDEEPVMTTALSLKTLSGDFEGGEVDSQPEVDKGPGNHTAHTFKVYDHRVPGQVHFNKRDMELKAGESENYDSFGDTQGDATLEGAVYGLFAADDIYGPDTQRDENGNVSSGIGVVFDANDLVAVATTDKNGDGSFLTITEKPHSFYNYKTGKIEYTGKSYPENLYVKDGYEKAQPQEERGRIYKDNKSMNGDSWIGRPLILGNYYIKELTRSEGYELSITGKDREVTNAVPGTRETYGETADSRTAPVGSAWITKQLYHAVTFPEGNAAYGNKENLLLLETKSKDATNGYNVVLDGIPEGADIYINNVTLKPVVIQQVDGGKWVDAKESPYYQTTESQSVYKRDINGNMIEKPGVSATVKVPYEAAGIEADKLPTESTAVASDQARFAGAFTNSESNVKYVKAELEQMMRDSLQMETPKDGDYSTINTPVYDEKRTVNGKTVYGKPEIVLEIENVTTNKSVIEAILNYYINEKVFTYGGLQKIEYIGGKAIVTIVAGMTPARTLLYQKNSSGDVVAAYLTKLNTTYGRYVIRKYTGDELNAAKVEDTGKYIINVTPDFEVGDDGIPIDKTIYPTDSERYLHYAAGETLYDYWYLNGDTYVGHAPVTRKVWEPNYKEVVVYEENVSSSKIPKVGSMEEVTDQTGSTYYYYDQVAKQYTIHVGSNDMDLRGVKSGNFTIALNNGKREVTNEDINRIGSNNVWGYAAGSSISNAEYVIRVSGAGAGAFTSADFDNNKTFIKNQRLISNGYHDLNEDGNTRDIPTPIQERIIGQQIKVTKTIDENSYENTNTYGTAHEDWFTRTFGGHFGRNTVARKMDNFRFKVYLKSNLERLHRDNDGNVIWQDRLGNEINVTDQNERFPALVNKVYTKVQHITSPLYKNSEDAVVSNDSLYSYSDGLINESQNNGYTSVLETISVKADNGSEASVYNYDKFFDAINVANADKWDHTENSSTAFKPFALIKKFLFGTGGAENQYPAGHNNAEIKNKINTSDIAADNALRSDNVRQFAIAWYLEDEVAKLVKKNSSEETQSAAGKSVYSDEVYDKALSEAIKKAENYLKPFFSYDLDRIYSIEWDSAQEGGADKDITTLSADTLYGDVSESSDGYYFATSKYLPYGTYVVAEQQPKFSNLGDLKNKHYQIDKPREVSLPSVYTDYDGSQATPEVTNNYYNYSAGITQPEMERKYKIRFNEESVNVIKGRNADGDFEVYKYGMDIDNIRNGMTGTGSGDYFALSQNEFKPYKNYYNEQDDRMSGNVPYYLSEGMSGREAVAKYYRYSSVAENKGIANDVPFPGGTVTEGNEAGIQYKDNVTAMQGVQTAYDGKYAPMLVPWTIVASDNSVTEVADSALSANGESSYKGFGYTKFRNSFYKAKLRIEKLDSETGENLLHDGALFALYAASREDGENTDGLVKFFETDTRIEGSKEFLVAMGARNIALEGNAWKGTVQAGTPICKESEQVILTDQEGRRTGQFEAFTITRDGLQAQKENPVSLSYQDQNVGYLTTPQPLGAGTYVLCEVKPPAGYVRTKPVAIEIYSDQTTYYLEGNRDNRVAAAIYEDKTGEGPEEITNTARIYIGNTPVRLEVSKIKDTENTVTYKTNTRLEGTELELKQKYGSENLEFAYKNGTFLGYAWYKGTLEYLESRKATGEDAEPVYVDGVFAGYGLISRPLDTVDDNNRYVAGAQMTLYDAIEIKENGDSGDYGYDGVEVNRDRNNNFQSIKVLKGQAGSTVEFIREEDPEGSLAGETGEGTWTYKTIDREDTDILFYSLGNLKVREIGTDGKLYGYDREGNKVQVKNQESIYVLKAGQPVFELTGGDLTAVKYSAADKTFSLSSGTVMYHLDSDGNRDAYVNPTTGMAFTREGQKLLVWPVKISRTENGVVIAREKIKTWRIASVNADTDQEYVTGTYDGNNLAKSVNPVLNGHGLPEYYQRSVETYKKGDPIYDIDGDYVRYRYDDLLSAYNDAAYKINDKTGVEDIGEAEDTTDDKKLYHRQGEAWIMENTWITGEKYPNDPFQADATVGQADMLKRVIPGTYIMEEVKAPAGYTKGFPEGITVTETTEIQKAGMEDEKIKIEIVKTDAPDQYRIDVISDYQEGLAVTEPKGAYSYEQVSGAHLVLYKAKRVYTTDSETYPKGYYYVKAESTPAEWTVENTADNAPVRTVADWITDGTPKYFEGIPTGDYILEEIEAAGGYVRSSMELTVKATGEVQTVNLKNDHTKLEIYKYYKDSKKNKVQLPNDHAAGLALYKAKTDGSGSIVMAEGKPAYEEEEKITGWLTDDLSEYTEKTEKSTGIKDRIKDLLGLSENQSSFITDFEASYREIGESLTTLTWYTKDGERTAERIESIQTGKGDGTVQTWTTDAGKTIRITIYRNVKNGSLDPDGKLPLNFEYQFNYKEENGVKSYDTIEGMHRIDYLPFHAEKDGKKVGNYVLVEEKTPDGFETADPKAITLTETGAVQRFSLENEEKYINVLKVVTDGTNEYAAEGAELALYRADEAGNFVEDKAHLIQTWLSGSDGRYTENDRFNGDIPEGFSVGDLKPHRIDKIPYGTFYIAELTAPAYMQKIEPVKILVGAEKIPVYRVFNTPIVGKLEIKKKASDTGKGLENARFKVTNKDTGVVWYMTTGTDGKAEITSLSVGIVQKDGSIKPYNYIIEEISPPDLYRITPGIRKFQFDGTESGREVLYTYEVLNDPTEIQFKKTNFDTGMAVEGAEIAVYEAVVMDGEYQKAGNAIETFVSGPDGFTLKKKLSANRVYIMEERKAPAGYTLSKPVIFTLNKAGTGIKNVSNDFSILKLANDSGAIENLTVTGRVPAKVYTVLKDLDAGNELPPLIGTGSGQAVTAENGIINGHTYEITEYTKFSDGRTEKSSKEIKRIYIDKDGSYTIPSRTYLDTRQELADAEGKVLASWTVNENNHDYTIKNPVTREIPIAQVTSGIGADHSAIRTGSVIKYTVTYSNPYNHPVDIRINAVLKDGLDYLRSTDYGAEQNGIINWNLTDIAAHDSGTVDLVAVVSGETGTQANVYFETKADSVTKRTTLTNPIAPDGSITIINKLTGTGMPGSTGHAEDQADEFNFHVKLLDSADKTLTGYQAYSGSVDGRIKGEGTIPITGDGYFTFSGLPYGTRYEITQEPKDGYDNILSPTGQTDGGTITGEVTKAIQSAVFKNNRNNETIREILTAGGNYRLTETTTYSDGSSLISGVYRFQLNTSGMVDNVDMEDRPVHLYFTKVDAETGEELTGGRYNLIDAETGSIIYEFTKEEGKEVLIPADLITPGKEYIILEEQPPAGYSYEKEIRFMAEESGIRSTIIMQDKKTEVEILKVDAETGDMLTGGRFYIREMDTGTLIKEFTANGGPIVLTGLLIAGKTYELSEEEPPAGYAYSESVIFAVPEEPGLITVVMKDKKTDVLIKKLKGSLLIGTPSEAASQLPGSTLQILNEDKTPARAIRDGNGFKAGDDLIFTTSQQFEKFKGQLEAGKDYWLHEIRPADGYAYAEDLPFTVSINGDEDVIVMIDDPTHVILSKKAITGSEELPGNHMSVKDKDGKIVEEWISGEQPHELIAKLKAGERYWLHEIRPVDGYSYAEDVSFIVSKNGTVDMVEMKNEVTAVRLNKVNSTGAFLKGAILQVLDHQKNVVIPDFETTGEAIDITGRLEAGKTYYLHEVKAPSGYLLSSDIAFTVPKGSELLEVTMTDPKQQSPGSDKMYLYKTDATTGQGMKGVEFSIYRHDGSLYLTVNTGEGGYAKFHMPENGTYTYKETKAAPGYLATDHTYSFTIQNGEVSENSTISVVNYLSPEVIIQKADAETMERLAGAELEIRNEAGEPVFKGITDDNGVIPFYPLRTGTYTVHEIKAPKGYRRTNSCLTIYVTDDGTVTGEFTMFNRPEIGKKKGYITAKYQSNLHGLGIIRSKGKGFWGWLNSIPKTGDAGLGWGLFLCFGTAGIVIGIAIARRRRDKKYEN